MCVEHDNKVPPDTLPLARRIGWKRWSVCATVTIRENLTLWSGLSSMNKTREWDDKTLYDSL